MKIFDAKPSISTFEDNCNVSIAIVDETMKDVLLGCAPATGITIDQTVDYSISKSLQRDFIVDTFGDSPTKITLDGVEFLTTSCGEKAKTDTKTIEKFYDENKLSSDNTKRVQLGLSTHGPAAAFTCVLVSMRSTVGQAEAKNMSIKYSLTLIGVRNT